MPLMSSQKKELLDRHTIFHALFNGQKVKPKQMFSTIKYYSPSCFPRAAPQTQENIKRYNEAVLKRIEREENFYNKKRLQTTAI